MSSSDPPVKFTDQGSKIVMDNGTVKVTISKPAGLVTAIRYGGIANLLSTDQDENSRGYWDMNWSETDAKDIFTVPFGAQFSVIHSDGDKLEVSFFRPFDPNSTPPSVPLTVDKSAHYAGIELCPQFRNGEAWRKVFGPVFVYLNKKSGATNVRVLWDDAKQRMLEEEKAWPYSWPSSSDYPKAKDRGQVSGRLLVQDRYVTDNLRSATNAYVGIALPGEKGSWQQESKGYQFWTQTDSKGYFTIENIRAGTYDLYGWVPGVIGDYIREGDPLHVKAGDNIQLGTLTYGAPRYGPTVWEIGSPDRAAAGYIPDPNPKYINKLFLNYEKYRNYGLWATYADLYPTQDLVYTVGTSDWTKDWFFAHVTRRNDADGTYKATTWQIKFRLIDFDASRGGYKFLMAIAESNQAAVQVKVNDPNSEAVYDTQQFGRDNAIARHGIHGLYALFEIDIPAAKLKAGDNTIYLTQREHSNSFNGVMYDYLRLEAPPS